MLVYYVDNAIWDIVILCLCYRSYSTQVQQSSLGRHGEHTYVRMKHCHCSMTSKPHGSILTDARLARDDIVQQCTRMHSKGDAPELSEK